MSKDHENAHLTSILILKQRDLMKVDHERIRILAEVIETRRTVKPHSYSGEEIDRGTIEKILESANWAPNHGRTEPWRFKVYCGAGKQRLLELMKSLYTETTPQEKYNPAKMDKMEVNCKLSSHIVVIMMKRQEIERVPEIEEVEAVACAVQNLALTATAYGVSGYWSSGGITYKDATRESFGLAEKDLVLGFYYLGLATGENPEGKRCSTIHEKIDWVEE